MRSIRVTMMCAPIVALAIFTASAQAGVPIQVSYQALLTNAGGAPVTGSHTLTFRLLENPSGGSPLWTEVHASVSVNGGLFTVALGSVTPLSSEVLAPAGSGGTLTTIERYLEVQVDGDSPMTPRTRLLAAPYAVASGRVAGDIETHPGELTISNESGNRRNLDKCTWTATHRSSEVDGIEVCTEQCDDDSSFFDLSGKRFGRPAINTARMVSGGFGALTRLTADDDGDGTAERGLIAGTTSIVGTPSSHLRGWNTGLGQESQFELDADSGGSSLYLDVDSDGDGLPDNSSSQTVRTSGVNLAIKTKGTGAHRFGAGMEAGTDSSRISNGSDEDADGRENSVFSSVSNVLKCRASCIFDLDDDGRADHAWSATVDGVRSRTILAADIDLDGTPDNVLTQTTDGIGASSTIQSRFASGPRQTTSMDGSFSHSRMMCITDLDADGTADNETESYSDSTIARMRAIVKMNTLEPHEARMSADRTGASMEIDDLGVLRFLVSSDSGLQLYDAGGVKTADLDSDGDSYFAGNLKIGTTSGSHRIDVVGGAYCDGTNWVNASDANSKENFTPVDGRQILAKLNRLSITRWNYKGQEKADHIGPTAQEFHAAFGVGTDDKSISTIDPSGIALAAIQALNQKLNEQLTEQASENENLRAQIAELREMIRAQANKPK